VAAQNGTLRDGTIVEQTPCAPNPVRTYEQYVEAFKRVQAAEVEAAKREGFGLEIPADQHQGCGLRGQWPDAWIDVGWSRAHGAEDNDVRGMSACDGGDCPRCLMDLHADVERGSLGQA
jgi:hypothetical protein